MLLPESHSNSEHSYHTQSNHQQQFPESYKGWLIRRKIVHGQPWLSWQHPRDHFPRYGCPLNQADTTVTVNYVQLMIDLSIELESQAGYS